VIGKSVYAVFQPADLERLQPILKAVNTAEDAEASVVEQELAIESQGRELKVLLTAGRIRKDATSRMGTVLLFDDITELTKAQQMAAWREVARRIAHEIKNPLTPIQLSAQRLQKLTHGAVEGSPIAESVQTIVENVDSIKRLANEFSNFSRMPTAELRRASLNALIADVLAPYAENHERITFQFIADGKAPDILMDREQVRRALMNLIENAANALLESSLSWGAESPRIVVRTEYLKARRVVLCEIIDNGPGVTSADKTRIFEPYFSTRKDGTGLGLAIVTSIVSDHQGVIRVFDNQPRGAKFQIEFPEEPRAVTQRKFVSS
jgi:two-component system nitrogen regulation sensor histidine kinase NtrY